LSLLLAKTDRLSVGIALALDLTLQGQITH